MFDAYSKYTGITAAPSLIIKLPISPSLSKHSVRTRKAHEPSKASEAAAFAVA